MQEACLNIGIRLLIQGGVVTEFYTDIMKLEEVSKNVYYWYLMGIRTKSHKHYHRQCPTTIVKPFWDEFRPSNNMAGMDTH
jgi:hypothetical protein